MPVLARLEQVEGIADVRVDATGRFFALVLAAGADEGQALAGAAAALRRAPRRLPTEEAESQLARAGRGDPWFTRGEVAELCFVEARMIAALGEGQVASAARLDAVERGALGDALRDELFEAMEEVLDEGGRDSPGWFYEAWPGIAARTAVRCAARIAPEKRERALGALAALHAR